MKKAVVRAAGGTEAAEVGATGLGATGAAASGGTGSGGIGRDGQRLGRGLILLAFAALFYNVLVILWGAFVRISGSGAGCGDHWPLCNGVALPPSPTLHTVIEFSHRLTSGLSGLLAIALVALAFLRSPRGHPVRTGAVISLLLIIFEGLVGGVQVLLGLTAESTNPARGFVQGVHLANTFLLLGALLLTAVWASGGPRLRLRQGSPALRWAVGAAVVLMLLLGMAGSVTALGDLLFRPLAGTPVDTVRRDFGASVSVIQSLRVVHPLLAIGVSAYLIWLSGWAGARAGVSAALSPRRWKTVLHAVIGIQILTGILNVILKAPGWMQVTHLLFGCAMWLATVMFCYAALTARPAEAPAPSLRGVSA